MQDLIAGGRGESVSTSVDAVTKRAFSGLGTFERYLTLWVFLSIGVGMVLGRLCYPVFETLGRLKLA